MPRWFTRKQNPSALPSRSPSPEKLIGDEVASAWAMRVGVPPAGVDWSKLSPEDWSTTMREIAELAKEAIPMIRSDVAHRPTALLVDLTGGAPVGELFRAWASDATKDLGLPHIPTIPIVAGRDVAPKLVQKQLDRAMRDSTTGQPLPSRAQLYDRPLIITECSESGASVRKVAKGVSQLNKKSRMTALALEASLPPELYEVLISLELSKSSDFEGSIRVMRGNKGDTQRTHSFCPDMITATRFPSSMTKGLPKDVRPYFSKRSPLPLSPELERSTYRASRQTMRAAGRSVAKAIDRGKAPNTPTKRGNLFW